MRRRDSGHGGLGGTDHGRQHRRVRNQGHVRRRLRPRPRVDQRRGHFPKPWSNAVDGIDNYVGSTEKDAPHMLGFTINVNGGAGAVCQSSYVHDDAWLGLACDEPGTGYDFTYAGTHDNESWIEAVRLTV
ncbi:hypothetical protein SHKM778_27780 [Streptomyces sp. KM77-8]|uniref:Uncharacterized protein n=1 Tax=Streptomyces haneummycinicus TaxID=3074435 RepID=A0AAT9HGE4_9ACTN